MHHLLKLLAVLIVPGPGSLDELVGNVEVAAGMVHAAATGSALGCKFGEPASNNYWIIVRILASIVD